MGQIATIAPSAMPVPCPLRTVRKVDIYSNGLEWLTPTRTAMAAADAPTPEDRALLEARLADIGRWLEAPKPSWIHAQLTALQAVRPPPSGSQSDQAAAQKIAIADLGGLPMFALAKAFEAAHRGEVGKPAFMPAPAELRLAAQHHVLPLLREQRRITAIVSAQVRQPIDPGRRKAAADAARAMFRSHDDRNSPATPQKPGQDGKVGVSG